MTRLMVWNTNRPSLRRYRSALAVLSGCLLLGLASSAEARVLRVVRDATYPKPDGASWTTAYKTIQAALGAARPGDEVWVKEGTYDDSVHLLKEVHLYGGFAGTETVREQRDPKAYPSRIVSRRSGNVIAIGSGEDTPDHARPSVVDGFHISHAEGFAGDGIRVWGRAVISRCEIRLNPGYGVVTQDGTALVQDCLVEGNRMGGVCVSTSSFYHKLTVLNNTIRNNDGVGGVFDAVLAANNVIVGNSGNSICTGRVVVNNTITANSGGPSASISATQLLANNIIAHNSIGITPPRSGSMGSLKNNCVYGNAFGDYVGLQDLTGTNGNIREDPKLASPYTDPHIQPDSPCRNTGDMSALQGGWTDIDGQPRVRDGQVDIGADESDGTFWEMPPPKRWYVSGGGSDGNDGLSWQQAKRSLSAALLEARGKDEVWVAKGTYREQAYVPPHVSVFGGFAGTEPERDQRDWSRNRTVIDVAPPLIAYGYTLEPEFNVHLPADALLDGFTVSGGNAGIFCLGDGVTIANNIITGSYPKQHYYHSSGIVCRLPFQVRAHNNVITGNSNGVGISWENSDAVPEPYAELELVNNTITANGSYGISLEANARHRIVNNIIAYNGAGLLAASSGRLPTDHVGHNIWYRNILGDIGAYDQYGTVWSEATGADGNNHVDPKLASPFSNPHIQPESPCRDAGDMSVLQEGWRDLDAQPRVQDGRVDIGADESDGTLWTVPPPRRIHVSTGGSDDNDGLTWSTAKRTVTAALNEAVEGDEVWVAEGTYPEEVVVSRSDVDLYGGFSGHETSREQRNHRAHPTVLDGSGQHRVVWLRGSWAILDGFTVRGGRVGDGDAGAGVYCTGSRVTISHNTIADNEWAGRGGGISISGLGFVDIHDNVIARNTARYAGGGLASGRDNTRIWSNLVYRNKASDGSGMSVRGRALVVNNTICDNTAEGLGGGLHINSRVQLVANNIIAFNSGGIYREALEPGAATPRFLANTVFGNRWYEARNFTYPAGIDGNMRVDPLFVDRAAGDYRMREDSPLRDAGVDFVIRPEWTDLDGQPRIQGAHVDPGAYELPGVIGYRWWDVAQALRIAGGLALSQPGDLTRLNVTDSSGGSESNLDVLDAVRLARKAAGLEPNP